jgi:hypothetical protein
MGNRDARGREKKKPKKTVAKTNAPPPRVVYKPVTPAPAPTSAPTTPQK